MAQVGSQYEGPGCPRCWTKIYLSVLEHESVYCGSCALTFTAALFKPRARAAVQVLPLEGEDGSHAQCARHARNAAVASCEHCGGFMCGLCRIDSDGQALCAPCFERLRSEGRLASAVTTFRSWSTLGLHLAIASLVLYPFGLLTGPAALVATVRGVAQRRKTGDQGGRGGMIASVLLGILGTVCGALFILVVLGALKGKGK